MEQATWCICWNGNVRCERSSRTIQRGLGQAEDITCEATAGYRREVKFFLWRNNDDMNCMMRCILPWHEYVKIIQEHISNGNFP